MYIGVTFENNGADRTGLTPTINIYDAIAKSIVISGGSVDEIGEGGYRYNFSAYDPTKSYFWKIDGGAGIPNRERYKRGWSWFAGPIPDAQAGTNGGLASVDGNNYIAGIQGTKNVLDDLNDLSAAQVNAEADTALSDYDPPTRAEMDSGHALLATPAQVNTEVVDALNIDTYAEPGQGAPPATTTLAQKIGYLFKFFRNKNTRNADTIEIYNDTGNVVDHKASISDDGSTFQKGEYETGP